MTKFPPTPLLRVLVSLGVAATATACKHPPAPPPVPRAPAAASVQDPSGSPSSPFEPRIDKALRRLKLEDKLSLLAGVGSGFETRVIQDADVPGFIMVDGPHGVRWGRGKTAFPTGIGAASSWNVQLALKMGAALAREARAAGRNVLLGPAVNIIRIPHNGRNFEYFSEDPHLTARLGVAYIEGVQRNGVIATVKHFAVNNQEHERLRLDARVDERARGFRCTCDLPRPRRRSPLQRPVTFPFGHGLAYATFAYSDVRVERTQGAERTFDVSVKVRNEGSRHAAEVVQVYVSERKPRVDRPPQELKGFAKVQLAPGEAQDVTVRLNPRAFAFYDVQTSAWSTNPGTFDIHVGASSRDIRLRTQVQID